jgi:hypothetical protein
MFFENILMRVLKKLSVMMAGRSAAGSKCGDYDATWRERKRGTSRLKVFQDFEVMRERSKRQIQSRTQDFYAAGYVLGFDTRRETNIGNEKIIPNPIEFFAEWQNPI